MDHSIKFGWNRDSNPHESSIMTLEIETVTRGQGIAVDQLLPIDLAVADYDRTRPLADGKVKPSGIALNVCHRHIGDFCVRPVYQEFDVAEMSFSWYVMARSRGEPVIALPIFPLRMPVLAYVLVRKDCPYEEPRDLIGRRIGVASYRYSVNLWLRGIFRDHYGVSPQDVTWVTCTRAEGAGYVVPPGVKLMVNESDTPAGTLQQLLDRPVELLERGEVDAILVPKLPQSFVAGTSGLRRLFKDAQAEGEAYVARTGFLPITHVMVMAQSLDEREPWIAESLLQAFTEAQRQCLEFLFADPKNLSLPDSVFYLEKQRAAYRSDIWAHGVAANRPALETFLRYAHDQGYTARRLSIEELFPQSVLAL
jgi:4,5-dihydroxyphthalate decarboxylase